MADVARLVADGGDAPDGGGWHHVSWGVARSSLLRRGERRLEAETYLSDGYGRRVAIESRSEGWVRLASIADVWQPNRLKGIVVAEDHGVPFLAAGQVFEVEPTPRKWLSLARTKDAHARFVDAGALLLSCSGTVGRVTIAHSPHVGKLITHDLLRIKPHDMLTAGWLYAYMRTASFRAMATGAHYGHVIKHLEPLHVESLPVVTVGRAVMESAARAVIEIFEARDRAHALIAEARKIYETSLAVDLSGVNWEDPFSVTARSLLAGRRRLDGYHHNPVARRVISAMRRTAQDVRPLRDVTRRVWWPGRFRRAFGENGTPYLSAIELFDLNPPVTKRIYAGLVDDANEYFLEPGWLVMARSGQIYGLNGRVFLASHRHARAFISEDLIRIEPDLDTIRSGYLLAALSHPTLGRPLVLRQAYGTSIPHLEPSDVLDIPVPRLPENIEATIADLMEEAARLRSNADDQEDALTERAEEIIASYLHG